ncbi:platelet endothelial cell adhesion molecule isoform X3 [Lampris incognitus]|uniref:platelet endothelial cell adhesion molecule isoform X3 n=1 Tax=Lampris incognitus TaxID=2546036 RepID=UPI0024B563D2|nr:platelet endothelial cell adhesion molecule isoform X3 [Lampris incognitus]
MNSRPPYRLLLLTSFLSLWQGVGGQSYTIDTVGLSITPSETVESGRVVILRCVVSVSHDSTLQLTHGFQFIRYDVPVYSLDTKDTSVSYRLSPARAADSGTYECQVTVKEKSKTSSSQKLTVTGLQTPELHLNKVQPFEHEEITATCSAPEEKGSLLFYFYQESRNGDVKKIKQLESSGNSSETKLVFGQVGDSHLYCNYKIPTLSEAGNSNNSNKVQVIVKALHITPTMNVLPSQNVYEGDIIEVYCKETTKLKDVYVFLTKDRKVLKKAVNTLSHRFRVRLEDSGELVCKAEWSSTQKETSKKLIVKELFSPPRLTIQPLDAFEGQRFSLTCSVPTYSQTISNETIQFSIYKDHVLMRKGKTYSAVAHPSLNGNYTCLAEVKTNGHILPKESPTLVFEVKVPVSPPVLSVVGGRMVLGKPFLLLCRSKNGSLPITYTLQGLSRKAEVRVVSRPGDQAVFNTTAIYKSSDMKNFLCMAKNNDFTAQKRSSGEQLLRTTNITEPVSKPELTLYPNSGDVSEGQELTLVCSVQKGTAPITYTWFHSKRKEPLGFQTIPEMKGMYSINKVRAEHKGDYYCESSNSANDVKRSFTITITVNLAGWKKGLIAVVCILITLVIIAFVIKKCLLPLRRSRTSELSVKSASSKVERLSLTMAEVNEPVNATPGVMGRSVWSEHVSGSESDDQNSAASPEEPETQYTEVRIRQLDPSPAVPPKRDTDTVYSEVRNLKQGAPEEADGGTVEYAQLNHDIGQQNAHWNHDNPADHSVQNEHGDDGEIIDVVNDDDCTQHPPPDC